MTTQTKLTPLLTQPPLFCPAVHYICAATSLTVYTRSSAMCYTATKYKPRCNSAISSVSAFVPV